MYRKGFEVAALAGAVLVLGWAGLETGLWAERGQQPLPAASGNGPGFRAIGPLAFAPDGTLFAADTQSAAIFALDLGSSATGGAPGAKNVAAVDQKIAAILGTEAREILVTDLAVHPKTRNAYISVMRGQGADARPALLRIDGAGAIDVVRMEGMKFSRAELPNAPQATPGARRSPRTDSITDMAFVDGRLLVAGLSNEEFASKLRAISYPFAGVDNGTSVEIYHGNHGQFETRSPVYTFVPYRLDGTPHLIAGYLCTPLVKFPLASLKAGAKVTGTTIAELGNRNRPLDMIVYKKDGQEFLLMANNSRGVMKIPTASFTSAQGITSRVESETGGVGFEPVAHMKGVEQLDLLDDTHTIVLARGEGGVLNLEAVPLP
ncbi:MAG TPA: hypothetical protein VLD67_02535 [Vicinamibacterales bacterium]|nr:hypothetical protein [Vicinamibacterales bacterium]